MTVQFAGRQLGDEIYANNLNKLAEFDYEEMGLDRQQLKHDEDIFVYGVGIWAFVGWDEDRQCPIPAVISPLSWIPDWCPDPVLGPRFHGFEFVANKHLLNNEQGYDQKALKRYIDSQQSKELKNNSQKTEEFIASHASDHDVALYHHYTIINGKKYHLTLTGDRKELLRCIELEASNDAEENNPLLIPYPICATNWIGVSDDPFGVNIFDILADKQMALQTFDNLARINAEFAVFGDKFLVDENMVQDISLLIQDAQGPTYIPYKGQDSRSPIVQIPKGQFPNEAWNIRTQIQENAYIDIGMDARSLGVSTGGSLTATENNRVQDNANLRLAVSQKESIIGQKQFWKLWHRFYRLYFNDHSIKKFQLSNELGYDRFELQKNDFITANDIDVTIKLKSQIQAERKEKEVAFMAVYGTLLQDPELGTASRMYLKRYLLEVQGFSREQIMVVYPYTPEEEQALADVEMLNINEELPAIEDINEDHLLYILIYDQAKDTEAKKKAIHARREAYKQSGQQQTHGLADAIPQPTSDPMSNMMINQMMNQHQSESIGAKTLGA